MSKKRNVSQILCLAVALHLGVAVAASAQDEAGGLSVAVTAPANEEGNAAGADGSGASQDGPAGSGGDETLRATLDSVVVTSATGFEQAIDDAPASISVITREQLLERPFNNLADALQDIPGISYTGGSGNERDITIRGLPAEYTLILIDGKRQSTRDSRPNGSGGFEADWIPPAAAIERIEVVRGPMSSLYGSDAMGGVINIITRKDITEWHGSATMDYTLQQHSDSGDYSNGSFYLGGPIMTEKVALQIFGRGSYRQEDKIAQGYKGLENKSITARLLITPFEKHRITLEAGKTDQERRITPGKSQRTTDSLGGGSVTLHTTKIREKHDRTHWSVGYDAEWTDIVSTKLNVYQEMGERRMIHSDAFDRSLHPGVTNQQWNTAISGYETYNARRPKITNTVIDGSTTLNFTRDILTVGYQYQHAKLEDDSNLRNMQTVDATVKSHQYALYAENDFFILDNLILTTGARMDHHSAYGCNWSPRGYLVYHVTPNWTLKGGVSMGFKTPTVRELSPGYATGTNGGRNLIYGNPDLEAEKSVTQEIGTSYTFADKLRTSLTLFNTNFRNRITSQPLNDGSGDYEYVNIGKARVRGVETELSFPILDNLRFSANYTYLHSRQLTDEGSAKGYPLTMTPKHKFGARLDWDINEKVTAYARADFTGRQTYIASRGNAGPQYRPSYTTFDVGGTWFVNEKFQVSAAIINLTDKRQPPDYVTTDDRWTTIEDGRRFWLSATVSF